MALNVSHWYRITAADVPKGMWRIETMGYHYGIEDRDGSEIIVFHWHPLGLSRETDPHLHLGPAAGVQRIALSAAHVPTGRLASEDALQLAVALGARPRRSDWMETLRATRLSHAE